MGDDKLLHICVGLIIYCVLRKCNLYKVSCVLVVILVAIVKECIDIAAVGVSFENIKDILATITLPYILMLNDKGE